MHNRFRGFELVDRIGSGGMSTIFLGVQTALDRKVAIKLLHPAFAHDEQFIARFEREAKSASSLGHPNVVTIIDFGSENGAYYIVMELVDGADLRSIFQRCDRIPPEITLVILEEICHGLEAAHEKGIVHRDIKPGNVLISSDGRVKVADFGLARQINDFDRMGNITMTGAIVGTPAYMSPEQLAGAPVDHRTDIYSLGVLAYEFFVGERPFRTTPSGVNTGERILRGAAPPMERDGLRLPRYIVDLVSKMLAKDPEKRFADITELLRAVENAMDQIDDSGQLLKHRRDYLKRFAQDPASFGRELRRRRLSRHIRRGDHFVGMGIERIEEAVEQYLAALRIDPENELASQAIARLEREHGKQIVTSVMSRTTAVFSTDPDALPQSRTTESKPGADPLLDGIDEADPLDAADIETRLVSKDGRNRDDYAGAASRLPPTPTEVGNGAPTQYRAPASGDGTEGLHTVTAARREGSVPHDDRKMPPPGRGSALWTRPWFWAVLVAALVAVPSLTLGPLGPSRDSTRPGEGPSTSIADGSPITGFARGEPGIAGTQEGSVDVRRDENATGPGETTAGANSGTARNHPEGSATTLEPAEASPGQPTGASSAKPSPDKPWPGSEGTEPTPPGSGKSPASGSEKPGSGTNPGSESSAGTPRSTDSRADQRTTSGEPRDPARETRIESGGEATASGFIEVRVVPVADIYVDGQLVGRKSRVAVHAADPNRPHTVEVRHPSFGTHTWPGVTAQRDTTQLVHRYRWGDVRVEWTPAGPADVVFDDVLMNGVPSFSRQVAVGEHRAQIRRSGYRIARVQIVDAIGTRTVPGSVAAGELGSYLFEVGSGETTRVNLIFEKE